MVRIQQQGATNNSFNLVYCITFYFETLKQNSNKYNKNKGFRVFQTCFKLVSAVF